MIAFPAHSFNLVTAAVTGRPLQKSILTVVVTFVPQTGPLLAFRQVDNADCPASGTELMIFWQ